MRRAICLLSGALLLWTIPARAGNPDDDPLGAAAGAADSLLSAAKARSSPKAVQAPAVAYAPAFDPEVPKALRAQILGDLGFLLGMRGSESTLRHREVFGPLDGIAYLRYLEDRVRSVGMDDGEDIKTIAYVDPRADPTKVRLAKGYVAYDLPQIVRASALVHEARHTEPSNSYWAHTDCPSPFKDENGKDVRGRLTGQLLAGQPHCDDTPIGAYGVEAIMLKNIAMFCATCSGKVRMDAALYGEDKYKRIFGQSARRALQDDFRR